MRTHAFFAAEGIDIEVVMFDNALGDTRATIYCQAFFGREARADTGSAGRRLTGTSKDFTGLWKEMECPPRSDS